MKQFVLSTLYRSNAGKVSLHIHLRVWAMFIIEDPKYYDWEMWNSNKTAVCFLYW
jgi:hypothetical protein